MAAALPQDIEKHRKAWEDLGIPYGECLCGCGMKTPISLCSRKKQQVVIGEPTRFVNGHNRRRTGYRNTLYCADELPCKKCSRVLPKKKFHLKRSHGSYIHDTECAECRKFYRYGITYEVYTRILDEQGGVCAICGQEETIETYSLSIDHCHTTGNVRGLLCNACNTGLGKFKDDIELLSSAIEYLKSSREEENTCLL